MTPEERAETACRSLTIREVVLTMPGGVTASFEVAPVIAAAIREAEDSARSAALEEAAKIAENMPVLHIDDRKGVNFPASARIATPQEIAAAIRERAKT